MNLVRSRARLCDALWLELPIATLPLINIIIKYPASNFKDLMTFVSELTAVSADMALMTWELKRKYVHC